MLELLKSSNRAVGVKQVTKALESGSTKLVFIAKDADENVVMGLVDSCKSKGIEVCYTDSMKLLGKACGIEVGAAAAAMLI